MSFPAGYDKRNAAGLVFITVAALVISLIIFNNFVIQRGPMRWDEAEHMSTSLSMAHEMQQMDLISLAAICHSQLLWPFLHTLMLAFCFVVAGPTILVGRMFSLLVFFAFSISLYFLGKETVKRDKHIAGIICALLGLTTSSLYLYASEAMLEITALLFFTLAVLFFTRYADDRRFLPFVPVFMLLTFFTKTNFGIVLILAVLIFMAFREKFSMRNMLFSRDFHIIFMPVITIIALWLLFPPDRLLSFLGFLVNRPEGPSPLSWEGLSFYPAQLFAYSGPIILACLAAFLLSFRYLKNSKVRFLLMIILLTVAINFFHQNKRVRYILYLYPPLFALTSFHLSGLYSSVRNRKKETLFFVVAAILFISAALHVAWNVRMYDNYYSVDGPIRFIEEKTRDSGSIFVLGEFNELSPGIISFSLSDISEIRRIAFSTYVSHEFVELGGVLEPPEKGKPQIDDYYGYLHEQGFDSIVIINLSESSIFFQSFDYITYNSWKQDYIQPTLESQDYTLAGRDSYEDIGVDIFILKKK